MKYGISFSRLARIISSAVLAFALMLSLPREAAAAEYVSPKLSVYAVFADRIALSVDNTGSYPSSARFDISVSGRYVKTVSASSAKTINLYGGARYFKPNTNYTVTVTPVVGGIKYTGASLKVKTEKQTYFKLDKGCAIYRLSGGKMKRKTSAAKKTYVTGALTTSSGLEIAGKPMSGYKGEYVRIKDGDHKGCYVKASDVSRGRRITAQRYIVSEYGKAMNGGSYVYGGSQFRRTDCSGLTMQCYAQVGMSISHSVSYQSTLGKRVSLNNMQPGDLIIMNYRSHVGMYVGGGKMVHAMNPYKGIRVEPISKLKYYHVDTVRRLIY